MLTHGFAVDEKGRKQSKSLGNVLAPQKVVGSLGADVLRLWVAATDYSNEMSVSDEILKRMADSYRRLRNTARFLLGNLHSFDPSQHMVAAADLVALDRWALARAASLQQEVVTAYRDYQYHLIYQKVHNFCVVDMGGFYLDVLKDRLYTLPADNPSRRSAQTALMWIAEAMVRWLAPILSFTAEEIWRFLPGAREQSVLHSTWAKLPEVGEGAIDWPALMSLRADVTRQLEGLREQGVIGAPLDAEVDIYCDAAQYPRFAALGEELRFLFITSAARVHSVSAAPAGAVAATTLHAGRRLDDVAALEFDQVRALLAPSARCGVKCCASRALQPLRDQSRGTRRNEAFGVNESIATSQVTPWYLKFGALRWGSLALLVILVDQITKAVVESRFDLFDSVQVLPFLEFTLLYNTGAAFNFLADASGWQRYGSSSCSGCS